MAESGIPASPISGTSVAQALAQKGLEIPSPVVLAATDSTNDEALALAAAGAPTWSTVVADQQRAGRGRLGRSWETPAGAALLFSTVLRPPAGWSATAWGWIPLIAGLAAVSAIADGCPTVALKWPNDVVIDGLAFDGSPGPRKLAGILAERRGDCVVVGIGINVHHTQPMLPIPAATSLAIEADSVARADLLAGILAHWWHLWDAFNASDADAQASGIRAQYKSHCLTIGRRVRVDTAGNDIVGEAVDIDAGGHLVVDGPFGRTHISAGDVTHLRTLT